MSLEPLTDYSKYKADCEKILLDYQSDKFIVTILRPATVCGYAPRQRLDVVVNILTNLAYHNREIKIFGGSQLRPNIHINDMVKSYEVIINAEDNKIDGQIFNVGYDNKSVKEIAKIVKSELGDDIKFLTEKTNDNRYLKFKRSWSICMAIFHIPAISLLYFLVHSKALLSTHWFQLYSSEHNTLTNTYISMWLHYTSMYSFILLVPAHH